MRALSPSNNLFNELFRSLPGGFYLRPLHGDPLPDPGNIRIDIKETPAAYTVQAEIPGVDKNDIQVSVERNQVTLRAEIKQLDRQAGDEQALHEERYFGSVSRSFQLPSEIDAKAAKARYENGLLCLTLPKRESATGRQIRVD